jgi:hypothetical protein
MAARRIKLLLYRSAWNASRSDAGHAGVACGSVNQPAERTVRARNAGWWRRIAAKHKGGLDLLMAIATSTRPAAAARTGIDTTKAWAWAGVAAFILGVAFTWAPAFFGVSESEAKDPALLTAALDSDTNLWIGRISSGIGFLTVGAVIVFAAGYRRLLEGRLQGSLIPSVTYTALAATAGALIIAAVFRAILFDSFEMYDSTIHSVTYSFSWDVTLASWTVVYVAAAASAVAAFRGVFSRWFGWVSAIMAGLGVLLAMVGLSFPAHIPALIWLLCASIVAIRTEESEARA